MLQALHEICSIFYIFAFYKQMNCYPRIQKYSLGSWTCLRVTQQSGLSVKNPPSRKSTIASNDLGFLSLHILLRFQQPLCLIRPKHGQLVIMTPLFSNQSRSFWNRNCWMTWLHSLKDDHSVSERSMTWEKNLLNVLCEIYQCSQIDLCHLKLNSKQGCSGREAWVSLWHRLALACYAFILRFSYMHFCSGILCTVEALLLFYGISFLLWCLTKLCDLRAVSVTCAWIVAFA